MTPFIPDFSPYAFLQQRGPGGPNNSAPPGPATGSMGSLGSIGQSIGQAAPGIVGGLMGSAIAGPIGSVAGSTIGNAINSANTTSNQGLNPSIASALGVGFSETPLGKMINGIFGKNTVGVTQANADINNAMSDIAQNGLNATVSATNAAADANPGADPSGPAGSAGQGSTGGTGSTGNGAAGDGSSGASNGGNGTGGDGPGDGGGFAHGGVIRGKGTATSDSITKRVSNGEGVLNAGALHIFGPERLHAINLLGDHLMSMGYKP